MSEKTEDEEKPRNPNLFKKGFDPRRTMSGGNKRAAERESIPAMCRTHSKEAIETILEILRDPTARARDRIKAGEVILERGLGKANQILTVEGSIAHSHLVASIDPTLLTQEQRIALLAARVAPEPEPILLVAQPRDGNE